MRASTPPGKCPFCLDPLKIYAGVGRYPMHCGEPECITAYFRCYQRDRRRQAVLAVNPDELRRGESQ